MDDAENIASGIRRSRSTSSGCARDEDYWDDYGRAQGVRLAALGRALWTSRFGNTSTLTAARDGGGRSPDRRRRRCAAAARAALADQLPRRLFEAGGGLRVLARADGLEAAQGATDFGGLFVALSFFLIGSAALLVALLFRLGVEQRAREVGLLRAVGFPETKVRRRFLVEGIALAAIGSVLGVAAAAGYANAMLAGLRGWWLGAVGTTGLELHLNPISLGIGWLASVLTVAATLWLALRNLRRVPASSPDRWPTSPRDKPRRVSSTIVARRFRSPRRDPSRSVAAARHAGFRRWSPWESACCC